MTKHFLTTVIEIVGFALIVTGIVLISVPIGIAAAGIVLVVIGVML